MVAVLSWDRWGATPIEDCSATISARTTIWQGNIFPAFPGDLPCAILKIIFMHNFISAPEKQKLKIFSMYFTKKYIILTTFFNLILKKMIGNANSNIKVSVSMNILWEHALQGVPKNVTNQNIIYILRFREWSFF